MPLRFLCDKEILTAKQREKRDKDRDSKKTSHSCYLCCHCHQHSYSIIVSGRGRGRETAGLSHFPWGLFWLVGNSHTNQWWNVVNAVQEVWPWCLPRKWANTSQRWWHWWRWKNKVKKGIPGREKSFTNHPRQDTTWKVRVISSRLVWLKDKELCFRKLPWKLSEGVTGGGQDWKQEFFSFLLQKPLLASE